MSEQDRFEKLLNAIDAQMGRLERAIVRLEIAQVMQNLMVMQLDGRIEVDLDTMRLYSEALTGLPKKLIAFRKHVLDRYSRK